MSLFENLFDQHERERHLTILADVAREDRADTVEDRWEGFLEPSVAASIMGVTEAELARMVARGLLETINIGGEPWVRPAVVSMLGIDDTAA